MNAALYDCIPVLFRSLDQYPSDLVLVSAQTCMAVSTSICPKSEVQIEPRITLARNFIQFSAINSIQYQMRHCPVVLVTVLPQKTSGRFMLSHDDLIRTTI